MDGEFNEEIAEHFSKDYTLEQVVQICKQLGGVALSFKCRQCGLVWEDVLTDFSAVVFKCPKCRKLFGRIESKKEFDIRTKGFHVERERKDTP